MKRFLGVLSVFMLILLFTGCGEDSMDISEAHYNYGLKAIEIADSYLDFDSTADVAYDRISALETKKDTLPVTEFDDPTHLNNSLVEQKVTLLSYNLMISKYEGGAYDDVLDLRNDIAEIINVKTR